MRRQQQIWQQAYEKGSDLPDITQQSIKPSSYVVDFIDDLKNQGITSPAKVIDIGCGRGRNAIYLAKQGFEVYGIDYIQSAITSAQSTAKDLGLSTITHFRVGEIDKFWPFADNFFDLAIDNFSSIDIETTESRKVYRKELFRILKPGGLALIVVVSINDEFETQLMQQNPGPERHSSIWPSSGKFQKNYSQKELKQFYQDFSIVSLKEIRKATQKLGKNYTATNLCLILKKPYNQT